MVSLWNPNKWKAHLVRQHEHFLTVGLVSLWSKKEFWVTNVYAPTTEGGRKLLWESLVETHKDWDGPWMVAGDFNTPLCPEEKSGGHFGWTRSMCDLGEFLQERGLMDVPLGGARFTWSNRRLGHNHIQSRLDRVLINFEWSCLIEGSKVVALPKSSSDHNPLLLEGLDPGIRRGAPFCFELMWLKHLDLKERIREWWGIRVQGTAMFRFSRKLNWVKRQVKIWNKEIFGNIFEDKTALLSELSRIEDRIEVEVRTQLLDQQELCTSRSLEEVLAREEIHWKQKSREQWLREGDRNTKFFHMSALKHRAHNRISKLRSKDGVLHDSEE